MPFAQLSTGATLHYEDINPDASGVPIIVVHGLLGTARSQLAQVMDWLAGMGYRVLGPSMRGYGQSEPKPRDFPYRFYHRDAADLIAFMDALEISAAHLLGYSDGGEIVLITAAQVPDQVRSVAAIGAVGNFGPELRPVFQRSYPGSWITPEEQAEHGIPDPDAFALGWVRASVQMLDAGGDVSLGIAHQITCPLVIMLGRSDTLNPEQYGRNFVARCVRGRVIMFDCGHPVHEQQFEAFRKAYHILLEEAEKPA